MRKHIDRLIIDWANEVVVFNYRDRDKQIFNNNNNNNNNNNRINY